MIPNDHLAQGERIIAGGGRIADEKGAVGSITQGLVHLVAGRVRPEPDARGENARVVRRQWRGVVSVLRGLKEKMSGKKIQWNSDMLRESIKSS